VAAFCEHGHGHVHGHGRSDCTAWRWCLWADRTGPALTRARNLRRDLSPSPGGSLPPPQFCTWLGLDLPPTFLAPPPRRHRLKVLTGAPAAFLSPALGHGREFHRSPRSKALSPVWKQGMTDSTDRMQLPSRAHNNYPGASRGKGNFSAAPHCLYLHVLCRTVCHDFLLFKCQRRSVHQAGNDRTDSLWRS
jgi:hypothetical protein